MSSFEEHCNFSELRTGKRYEELHRWMDEFQKEMGIKHREKRHSLNDIDEVRKKWGDKGVEEFLVHVIADYRDTSHKLRKVLNDVKGEKNEINEKLKGIINEPNELLGEAKNAEFGSWVVGLPSGISPIFRRK